MSQDQPGLNTLSLLGALCCAVDDRFGFARWQGAVSSEKNVERGEVARNGA